MSRPLKYDPEIHIQQAEELAATGMTNVEIAKAMNIQTSTLYDWKNKYEQFSEALKKGKDLIDDQIVQSLFERARGYETVEIHEEEIILTGKDKEDNRIEVPAIKRKTVTKHVVDTTAQIFWLKNRRPQEWRDKKEFGIESNSFADWVKSLKNEKE